MIKKDSLQRFIFEKSPIRGEFIFLDHSFQTIISQHAYPSPIRRLLGEALCVAGLLSALIKFDGRLTVQFRGRGKLKLLLAQCDNHYHLRGLAKWDGDLTYEDLMESFYHGLLVIMLDQGLKSRYQGIVSWHGHSLVESIEKYFQDSEQLATKLWLNVSEHSAAGLLLQVVPTADQSASGIEKEITDPHWSRIIKLTLNLNLDTMSNIDFKRLLHQLYPEEEIRIFPAIPVSFHCTCSRKRGEDAILLLGKDELDAELKDKHIIVVTCDFCNKEYMYDRVDVAKLFSVKDRPPSSIH